LLPPIYLVYGFVVIALIAYQHRDNMKRLRRGTERQLW
jgi:glycerol-3-phosphate acyltransferase PlsY